MADSAKPKPRKRRRLNSKMKLLLDDLVEVRSVEDGFQGSWHAGEIISCEDGCREVRYLHLLQDNENDFLTEVVEVCSSIDRISTTSRKCDRGRIRPIPTFGDLAKENLNYGLCVDCWYQDAWWEGVVFYYKDGSTDRKILKDK